MGKQQKNNKKPEGNRFKKQFNNYNPYNKLQLNKFHQLDGKAPIKIGHQLHKKKRDLERMIQYRKSKGLDVEQIKIEELDKIGDQLQGRKKGFQKEKRKEFFIEGKYKQIMNIQKRKVAKKIREIKEEEPVNQEVLSQWYKKLNYIKHFPKTLKYVSLFPTSPMSEKALEFQAKIMNDIQTDLAKQRQKKNSFQPEYKKQKSDNTKKQRKDDFFLEQIDEQLQNNQQQ